MKKYILIYAYGLFNELESNYWNELISELNEKGYEIFFLTSCIPKHDLMADWWVFPERLDDVECPLFTTKNSKTSDFENQVLNRERQWYKSNSPDRLKKLRFLRSMYRLLLENLNPNLVVLANGQHATELILKKEVAELNIPLIYFERGCLPKSWHFDLKGITASSTIAKSSFDYAQSANLDKVENYFKFFRNQSETWWHQPENLDAKPIREKFGLSDDTKIVLFANQLDNDTSNLLHSPNFSSNLDAFRWFANSMTGSIEDIFFLVKKHPMYKGGTDDFTKILDEYDLNGKWVDDIPLFECLKQCDYVAAVNSTLIFEALIFEKPVLQLGMSILDNKQIVYHIDNPKNIQSIHDWLSKKDFKQRLSRYKQFMAYMIDHELSFFLKEKNKLNLKGEQLAADLFLSQVRNDERTGKYPLNFLFEYRAYQDLKLKNYSLSALSKMLKRIITEIGRRSRKKIRI